MSRPSIHLTPGQPHLLRLDTPDPQRDFDNRDDTARSRKRTLTGVFSDQLHRHAPSPEVQGAIAALGPLYHVSTGVSGESPGTLYTYFLLPEVQEGNPNANQAIRALWGILPSLLANLTDYEVNAISYLTKAVTLRNTWGMEEYIETTFHSLRQPILVSASDRICNPASRSIVISLDYTSVGGVEYHRENWDTVLHMLDSFSPWSPVNPLNISHESRPVQPTIKDAYLEYIRPNLGGPTVAQIQSQMRHLSALR